MEDLNFFCLDYSFIAYEVVLDVDMLRVGVQEVVSGECVCTDVVSVERSSRCDLD